MKNKAQQSKEEVQYSEGSDSEDLQMETAFEEKPQEKTVVYDQNFQYLPIDEIVKPSDLRHISKEKLTKDPSIVNFASFIKRCQEDLKPISDFLC